MSAISSVSLSPPTRAATAGIGIAWSLRFPMTTDHGLIFQPWGVRQILAGNKLCTRRAVTRFNSVASDGQRWWTNEWNAMRWEAARARRRQDGVPYWEVPWSGRSVLVFPKLRPGHTAWVREVWVNLSLSGYEPVIIWRADGNLSPPGVRWRSPLHLPRKLARITLRITEVRAERLQDITEEDARLEGVEPSLRTVYATGARTPTHSYRDGFACAWDEINAKRASWESNPPVWRYGWDVEGVEVR
jgi:hypothetical protein